MPSYSFVGDEPMSTLCATKAKDSHTESNSLKAPSLAQDNPPSVQHPCQIPDPVAVVDAREAAGYVHPSNKQDNYRLRISHSQAGKLGVNIKNGKQCIVVAKLNQHSQLNVNDIILSVNGHKYEDLIKSEWLKLFQAPGVREFIVLRPQENNTEEPTKEDAKLMKNNTGSVAPGVIKCCSALAGSASGKVQAAPLKDIGNTNTKVPVDVVKIPSSHGTNEHLLQLVASQWTTGKSSHQTSQCKAAIRSCLLADMRPFTIAKHVVKQVTPEHQATEYERARKCAQRIQKSMSKEFETEIVDLHDIMKSGMPFQRKGVVFKRGDQPPKRKALSVLEQGLLGNHTDDNARKQSRLCSQNEELIGQQATADKQCISSPVGKLITPSNSMEEEPMSPLSVE